MDILVKNMDYIAFNTFFTTFPHLNFGNVPNQGILTKKIQNGIQPTIVLQLELYRRV